MDGKASKPKKEGVATLAIHGAGKAAAELWETLMREKAREEEKSLKTSNFVVRFSTAYKLFWASITVLLVLIGGGIQIFAKETDIAIFFYVFAAIPLWLCLYSLSYRCTVDEKKMVRVEFWIFKKEISWNSVKYKKTTRVNEYQNGSLTLYDERQKRLIDFVSEQTGFQNMERLVKRKRIPSRHKKIKK